MKTTLPAWCKIVREPLAAYEAGALDGATIRDASGVAKLLGGRLEPEEVECFVAVLLNGRNRVLALTEVSRGTVTAALVHPREVFRPALAMGACAIILAHNHPSGDASPSPEDHALTDRLRQAGELLGVRVLDHVVIAAPGRFVSMAELGRWG